MTAVIVTIWLSCLPVVESTGGTRGIPADILYRSLEVRQGELRELQKLVNVTKDIPLPINCTVKYEVRPKP